MMQSGNQHQSEHGAQEEASPALRGDAMNGDIYRASCLHSQTWDGVLKNNGTI